MIEITNTLLIIIFTFIASFSGAYFILMQGNRKTQEAIFKGFLFAVFSIILILFILINY